MDMSPQEVGTSVYEFEGKMVTINRRDYCAAELTMRQLKHLLPKIDAISKSVREQTIESQIAVFDAVCEILAASLSRNHPQINADFLLDNLGVAEGMRLFEVVMDISGLQKGVRRDGGTGEPSTGTQST